MKISKNKRILAIFIGFLGFGLVWSLFSSLGITDANSNAIGTLVAIIVSAIAGNKLTKHYTEKWSTNQSN